MRFDTLHRHVGTVSYLLGWRPCLGDFGLYGQLQIRSVAPTTAAEMRARAPDLFCWLLRLDDASGIDGQWIDPLAPLPDTVQSLLAHMAETYLPFLAANAKALQDGAPELEVELLGRSFRQAPFRYQAKCYDALRKRRAALPVDAQRRLDPILEEAGCLAYLT